jgi:serine/threonine-protein kinase RsbT
VKPVLRRATTDPARSTREVSIAISSEVDVMLARQKGRALAAGLRFSAVDLALIATAISELARNVISYAESGEIVIRRIERDGNCGVEVVVHDRGPGIDNIDRAIQDGYSTSGGLGLGLPGVRRLMDEFEIVSRRGGGTTVTVTKWRR